jgi:hypothetical protein
VQAREVWESYGDFVRSAKPEFGPSRKVMAAARAHVHDDRGEREGGALNGLGHRFSFTRPVEVDGKECALASHSQPAKQAATQTP